MKIVSIVGARPQFIKLAPISSKLRRYYEEKIVHTGQHYDHDMSGAFFQNLNIPVPDYNLNVKSGTHGQQTGKMLELIEKVLLTEMPELAIVFGDTNSTVAGALAATKLHIPLLHIEAGLRSFNREMPEEINRIATDHISDLLFAPTTTAIENLSNEGLDNLSYLTGDIMVDTLRENLDIALKKSQIVNKLDLTGNFYLMTLHRPYNVDTPETLSKLLCAADKLNYPVVFPLHPRTKQIITSNDIEIGKNIKLINPVNYLDFITLQYFSDKVITDSGGVQKEAYILQKPCITVRPETEWVETIHDGWNVLFDLETQNLSEVVEIFTPNNAQTNVFGSNVSDKMISIIKKKCA